MNFEEKFPSLKDPTLYFTRVYSRDAIERHCLDKERVREALSKYSKLNNKMIKSFESMEDAMELNNAWNTMIDELGI